MMIPKSGPRTAPKAARKILIITGLLNRFQGVITRAITAEIKPPRTKLIFEGHAFAKSYAGETKLATTLIPNVATEKVDVYKRQLQSVHFFQEHENIL